MCVPSNRPPTTLRRPQISLSWDFMAGSFLYPAYIQENDFLSSLFSLLIISPSPFLSFNFFLFSLPFISSLSLSFFSPQLSPRQKQRGPKPSVLWLHMHNFKAYV